MPASTTFKGKLLIQEFVIFGLVQVLGLLAAFSLFARTELVEMPVMISLWQFIVAFALATVLVIIALRLIKGNLFFKVLFFLAIFFGAELIFNVYFPAAVAIALATLLVLLRFVVPQVWSHNLAIILGLAGVGAAFGLSLPVAAVLLILFLLSIYDYIAVYKTDYMVTMFRGLAERGAIFAAILPTQIRGWFVNLDKVKPGSEFVFLGTGDMVLPLILSASAVSYGFLSAVFSFAGSLVGLVVLHILFTSQKKKVPMPALPPLALFAALGFVVSLLLK